MNQRELDYLIQLVTKEKIGYNPEKKVAFASLGKRFLREIVKRMKLEKGTYDIRFNEGGIAVSGECILHTERIYVQIAQWHFGGAQSILYRSCKGRQDYFGGCNQWIPWERIKDLEDVASTFLNVG